MTAVSGCWRWSRPAARAAGCTCSPGSGPSRRYRSAAVTGWWISRSTETGFSQGNADDLLRLSDEIESFGASELVVMSADHVFSLDLRPVLRAHRDAGAECTLMTAEVSRAEAEQNAVVVTDNHHRVTQFPVQAERPGIRHGGHRDLRLRLRGAAAQPRPAPGRAESAGRRGGSAGGGRGRARGGRFRPGRLRGASACRRWSTGARCTPSTSAATGGTSVAPRPIWRPTATWWPARLTCSTIQSDRCGRCPPGGCRPGGIPAR